MHEQQRRIDGVIELGELACTDAHQPPVIEADHQWLRALRDQLGRHQPTRPCGGAPVDGPQWVVGERLADAVELTALGAEAHGPQAELGELTAPRERLVDIDGGKVRVDAHCACGRNRRLSPADSPRSSHADCGGAEHDIAARDRRHRVLDARGETHLPLGL